MSDLSKCPFHAAQAAAQPAPVMRGNRDWWPNALNLAILHQHAPASDPMGPGFDYSQEFRKLDLKRQELNSKQHEVKSKLKQREKELDRKERELALSIQKFQFDGAQAALKHLSTLRSIAADRSLNSDEKIEAVRLKLWGTAPEVKP